MENIVVITSEKSIREQLGIDEDVWNALLQVRDRLASGELHHEKLSEYGWVRISHPVMKADTFNMRVWRARATCRTVCCIGGEVENIINRNIMRPILLYFLFYPHCYAPHSSELLQSTSSLLNITPAQAVQAIDNFMIHTPGNPQWRKVVSLNA